MNLSDWLALHGGPISVAVIDAMYVDDPFWLERFGENGRKFAREDGGFHIRHLVTALDVERDEVMVSYARWLRSVLVARGMASFHLADNFRRLAVALAEAAPMSTFAATKALDAGVSALAYDSQLSQRQDELAAQWLGALGVEPTTEHRTDATTLFSFVADTVAMPKARSLTGYVAYRANPSAKRGVWRVCEGTRLREALLTVVQHTLPNEERNNIVGSVEQHWTGSG